MPTLHPSICDVAGRRDEIVVDVAFDLDAEQRRDLIVDRLAEAPDATRVRRRSPEPNC